MMRRLTRVLFGHTFRKLTLQVNKITESQRRCEARDVSNAQTDLSLRPIARVISVISLVHVLSSNPNGAGIRHTANRAPVRTEFYYRFNNMHILSGIS